MAEEIKWTIRNVTDDARAMADEVHETTGIPYGRLISEAITCGYQDLPEENPYPSFRRASTIDVANLYTNPD